MMPILTIPPEKSAAALCATGPSVRITPKLNRQSRLCHDRNLSTRQGAIAPSAFRIATHVGDD
jgi:hypothetical protein